MTRRVFTLGVAILAMMLVVGIAAAAAPANAGMRMLQTEDYQGAQAWFAAALRKDPRDAQATASMAKLALAKGDNKAAVEWARKATLLEPRKAEFQILLGYAYGHYVHDVNIFHKLGIAHKALAAFRQAVQLAPDNAKAHADLGSYYIQAPVIASGSTRKARMQIAILDKLDPALANQLRAELALEHKDLEQAVQHLRVAAAYDTSGDSDFHLGVLLAQQKNYEAAFGAFADGMRKNPGNARNYYQFGRVAALSKSHVPEGIAHLRHYLASPHGWQPSFPSYNWAHVRLGALYVLTGDKLAARREYQTALAADANFKQARKALDDL